MADNATDGLPIAGSDSCRIEAIVTIDERGQMVLPKEIRERAGIRAGDKLAIVGFQDQGRLCCVSFFKVEELSELVRTKLAPVMKLVFEGGPT